MKSKSFSPFGEKHSRLIEKKDVSLYDYTYVRLDHFEQFKKFASYFVGYLKLWEPIDNLKVRMQIKWVIFISEILKKYNHPHAGTGYIHKSLDSLKSFRESNPGTIATLIKKFRGFPAESLIEDILGLKYINLTDTMNHYKNVWGSRYWTFLHHTSFCINGYGKDLINSMADLMLNLHMVIVCPVCYENLLKHDMLDNVTIVMRKTQDPITIIYNFHNIVNNSINDKYNFSQNEFCNKYECKMKLREKIDYIQWIYC